MRLAVLLSVAALAAACATVPATAAQPEGSRLSIAPGDENCDVTVVFGSYAMGLDGQTFTRVDAYLKRRAPAVTANTTSWGREGERTICVTTRYGKATRKVFNDIRNMTPRMARRGPVEIRSRFGTFQSRPPEAMRR